MRFLQSNVNLRVGGRPHGEINNAWAVGAIWISYDINTTKRYYATVIKRPGYWSIITQQLHPNYRIYNGGTLYTTVALSPQYFDSRPVYEPVSGIGASPLRMWYTPIGVVAMRQVTGYGYPGYLPDANDEYWLVQHPYINMQPNTSPFVSGTLEPRGTATQTLSISAYWPRWELQGYYYLAGNMPYHPAPGIYQPCDGATGTIRLGKHTDTWVPDYGWSTLYMGEGVVWR